MADGSVLGGDKLRVVNGVPLVDQLSCRAGLRFWLTHEDLREIGPPAPFQLKIF